MTNPVCLHCDEEILPGEQMDSEEMKNDFHRECLLRKIFGSVAHQQRECLCFRKGSDLNDDPNLSTRENAKAARRFFVASQTKEAKAKFN